jgi:hypothetical protein
MELELELELPEHSALCLALSKGFCQAVSHRHYRASESQIRDKTPRRKMAASTERLG